MVQPFTPFTSSSIAKSPQSPSQADGEEIFAASHTFANPSPIRRYVETIDGIGYLSGNRQEQDVTFVAPERKERLRYKVGVVLLSDGGERFYIPGTLSNARPEAIQTCHQTPSHNDFV